MTDFPVGLSWSDYVTAVVDSNGGWSNVIDQLYDRARGLVELPLDPGTVEKGLRRLAKKQNEDGGQYGRWLTRFFPVPESIETWAKWCGQYHSRFSDLPVRIRTEQLRILDRPPVSETSAAIWIQLGLASIAHRQNDSERMNRHLEICKRVASPTVDAQIERELFLARVAENPSGHLDTARELIGDDSSSAYFARWVDQVAYQEHQNRVPDFTLTEAMFDSITPQDDPFVAFRKSMGLAFIYWKTDRASDAKQEIKRAIENAGDGGLVRFRVMALNLASHIFEGPESGGYQDRARRLAEQLEDEELLSRIHRIESDG